MPLPPMQLSNRRKKQKELHVIVIVKYCAVFYEITRTEVAG